MKLYCKLDVERKEVGYRDHRNRVVKGFFVKPYEPTEIPDHHAKEILKQNPHLVDTKPLKKMESEAKEPQGEKKETQEKDEKPQMVEKSGEPNPELLKKLHVVKNVAQADLSKVKTAQIREWGRELGVKIPSNAPRKKQVEMLEEACEALVKEAEGVER